MRKWLQGIWTFKTWIFQFISLLWDGEVSPSLEIWHRKKYSSRWIKLWLQKETIPKSQVYFSLTLHAQQRSAWSSNYCHSEYLRLGGSILTSVSTITKTEKKDNRYSKTAIKCFFSEVMHVSFVHICLAKASHLATYNLSMVERCNLLPGELKYLWTSQWAWTLISTTERHILDGRCHDILFIKNE